MSNAPKHQPYFYMGAEYGLPILIIAASIIALTTLIGIAIILTAI